MTISESHSSGLSDFCSSPASSFTESHTNLKDLLPFTQAHRKSLQPESLEGREPKPPAFTFPFLSLPQISTATATITITVSVAVKVAAAVAVLAAVLARAHGEQRPPGAPAAPAAAGGSGCWACCSPGCCSWGCSSASLLWVRGDGGRAAGPTAQLPIQRAGIGCVPSVGHQCRALCCRWGNRHWEGVT